MCVDGGGGGGGSEILLRGIFLLDGGNLRKSNLDHLNLFQSWKQLSVNTEHKLKSKLAWPVYKEYEINWKLIY